MSIELFGGVGTKKKEYSPPIFQHRLKECMALQDVNAVQLAEKLGYERKSIYAWTNGVSVPNIVVLNQLCSIFHVSADWLIGRK